MAVGLDCRDKFPPLIPAVIQCTTNRAAAAVVAVSTNELTGTGGGW